MPRPTPTLLSLFISLISLRLPWHSVYSDGVSMTVYPLIWEVSAVFDRDISPGRGRRERHSGIALCTAHRLGSAASSSRLQVGVPKIFRSRAYRIPSSGPLPSQRPPPSEHQSGTTPASCATAHKPPLEPFPALPAFHDLQATQQGASPLQ
jgi:hypothetical protein